MYYSSPCPYCRKNFYTFYEHRESAAKVLFVGIKAHQLAYNEDHKEYTLDDAPSIEIRQMYTKMTESTYYPRGAYQLR